MSQNTTSRDAADISEMVRKSLESNHLSPTPENYTVWYHYHIGAIPELVRALDIMVANNRDIDEGLTSELYEQFFTSTATEQSVQDTGSQLENVILEVINSVTQASKGAGEFGDALETFSGGLADNTDSSMRNLFAGILTETRKIQAQNSQLHSELNSYNSEISRLREDLEFVRREARTDALTGLANRKYFDNFLRESITESAENSTPLSLMITDVDHFKQFNDTYGHQLGDQVLRVVSSILKKNTKGKDLAARYGGEEFCVVLPNTDLQAANTVAEHIRNAVAAKKIYKKRSGEELRQVTVSVGVASFEYGEPVANLISRADKALYKAKENGRNQVVDQTAIINEL